MNEQKRSLALLHIISGISSVSANFPDRNIYKFRKAFTDSYRLKAVRVIKCALKSFDFFNSNLGNANPVKLGRCFSFLNNYYGISKGNNQHSSLSNNSVSSQDDLAKEIGISVDTLQNYKQLAEMIPELEELIDTGIVTKDTALAIIKNA